MDKVEDGTWLVLALKADEAAWIWVKACADDADESEVGEKVLLSSMEARDALLKAVAQPQPNPGETRDPQDFVKIFAIGSTPRTREGCAGETVLMNAIRPGKAIDLAWCADQVARRLSSMTELAGFLGPYECAGFESEADAVRLGLAFVRSKQEAKEMESATANCGNKRARKAAL